MKVAITGSRGFLGKEILTVLKKLPVTIRELDRENEDLLNTATLKRFITGQDVLVHLAAVNKFAGDEEIQKVNIDGTRSILEALRVYSPMTKLVFASSFQVYLRLDSYGKSKKKGEELIEEYGKKFHQKAIILRFANLYGDNMPPFKNSVISTFAYQAKHGQTLVIDGDGSQTRDYLHVHDAAVAIVKALSYTPRNVEVLDICSGKATSLREIVDTMKRLSKNKVEVKYTISTHSQVQITKNFDKAKTKLDWTPTIGLADGIRSLV